MTNFLPSNPQLDAALANETDPERIRELVKSNLAARGVIERERGNDFGVQVSRGYRPAEQPTPEVSLPENPDAAKCSRRVYPHENDVYEIFGETEEELDKKEAEIRARY
jgi:hypothetical protein